MSICELSVKHFKALRYSHDISAANLADVLELKSSASITNIENGKAAPSYELLERYADTFAVSVDWLMGRSDKIYTHDSLLKAEQTALAKLQEVDITGEYSKFDANYLDVSARCKSFSPKARGSIIFLMVSAYIPLVEALQTSKQYNNNPSSFMDKVFNLLVYRDVSKYYDIKLTKKNREKLDLFASLIHNKPNIIAYDIEAYLQQKLAD